MASELKPSQTTTELSSDVETRMDSLKPSSPEPSSGSGVTRASRVFNELQSAITKGEIKAGSKINEAELAANYGISRGPLREALQRLESCHLIERIPHVGTKVVSLNLQELLEIYQVREVLEALACRLAAENMSAEEVQNLRALLVTHEADNQLQEGASYFQKEGDLDFHYKIVQASKNEHLHQLLLSDMYHLLRMYRYQCSLSEGRPQKALKEHHQIIDAIEDRDGDLAEMLMKKHIRLARKNIESQYDQKDFDLINGV